jgi:hypothetical protein
MLLLRCAFGHEVRILAWDIKDIDFVKLHILHIHEHPHTAEISSGVVHLLRLAADNLISELCIICD